MNKRIDFNGIKRNKPETQYGAGDCEHVINMRHKNGAWRAVGKIEDKFKTDTGNSIEVKADDIFYLKSLDIVAWYVYVENGGSTITFRNTKTNQNYPAIFLPNEKVKNILNLNETIIIITDRKIRYYMKMEDSDIRELIMDEFSLSFFVNPHPKMNPSGTSHNKNDENMYSGFEWDEMLGAPKKEYDRLLTNYIRKDDKDFFCGCLILTHAIELYDGTTMQISPLQFVINNGFYALGEHGLGDYASGVHNGLPIYNGIEPFRWTTGGYVIPPSPDYNAMLGGCEIRLNRISYKLTFPRDVDTAINHLMDIGLIKEIAVYGYHFDPIEGENFNHFKGINIHKNCRWEFNCGIIDICKQLNETKSLYKIGSIKKLPTISEDDDTFFLRFDLTEFRTNKTLELGEWWNSYEGNISGIYDNMLYLADTKETVSKRILNTFYGGVNKESLQQTIEYIFYLKYTEATTGKYRQLKREILAKERSIRSLQSIPYIENSKDAKMAIIYKSGVYDSGSYAGKPRYRYAVFFDNSDNYKIKNFNSLEKTDFGFFIAHYNKKDVAIFTSPPSPNDRPKSGEWGEQYYNNIFSTKILSTFQTNSPGNPERWAIYTYSTMANNRLPIQPFMDGEIVNPDEISDLVNGNESAFTEEPTENPNLIRFSKINNPFAFDVLNAYRVGTDKILDVNVNLEELSTGQFGQYPPVIFTQNGIYSLLRQNANVIFSNIDQISNDLIMRANSSFSTNYGIFFASADGKLKVINGKKVATVSDDLLLDPSKLLNGNQDYELFIGNKDFQQYGANHFPALTDKIPKDNFADFLQNAIIGYFEKENELIISNNDKGYSYIFNIAQNLFSIRTEAFVKFIKSYPGLLAVKKNENSLIMYNSDKENVSNTEILIETKPINSSEFLTNYRRIILRMFKDKGSRNKIFNFSIFGSDDCNRWNILTAKQIHYDDVQEHKDVYIGHGWKTLKYYKIVITASLNPSDYISHIDVDIDSTYDEKLR